MDLVIPPDLADEVVEQVQRTAVESFRVTECEGMARVDCFVVDGDRVIVNELNTIPGFTATSVYAKLFEASGIPYGELLQRLIALALERHERKAKLAY
jgi:D-alanine-D-alanine ligase